ncbi:MAG TPA: His-Xaa-Ser system radical SAM maturase HxsB [Kofleriaceae bacterium]|jgi:His-Xaa-Ser system radical SAM maturase HxsB|nr:His-Xaa-Ser system radical SAM maturase HxsB [Kofleriaceae bacterium]
MTGLHPRFHDRAAFAPRPDYRLLPFRFIRLDDRRYVMTNDVGEHVVVSREQLVALVKRELPVTTQLYRELTAKHLVFDDESRAALDLLAVKYRTRAAAIADLTGLHIFVVTLRCDHSCHYCQVSRQTEDKTAFDMTREHADKALALVFQSPNPAIKIEFQGGEPLLNFALIQHIVQEAERRNACHGRDLQFVIASNLTHLDDHVLAFARAHRVFFSTSLDGPEDLHNANRPLRGGNSHRAAVDGIQRIREALGHDAVAALMTTTPASLARIEDIIDEYVRLGFTSIFLRSLSPYGFAIRTRLVHSYDIADWIAFYQRGLRHILALNRRGVAMREELAAIILQKMFAPAGASYVDLQSPAGVAIGALVYNYDGKIYGSDEGRMLAEMGDDSFCLGSLDTGTFASVMTDDRLHDMLEASLPESAPMCSDCGFLPWCGADPAFHRATQRDAVGHKAFSAFCAKQMAVLRHLVTLLEDDPEARRVLMSWV